MALVGLVAAAVLAFDQLSKVWVIASLAPGRPYPVLGEVLQFIFVRNPGAAFSLASGSTWIFSVIATAVTVFIVWFAGRIRSRAWAALFGLLLGGTTGNLADRLFREPGFAVGEVIDFLKIPLLPAIFNLADVAIVSSMTLFILLTLRGVGLDGSRARKASPPHPETPDNGNSRAPSAAA